MNSSTHSADGDHFSPAALSALQAALGGDGSKAPDGDGAMDTEALRDALTMLSEEAHARQLGPEIVIIALKSAWAQAPGSQSGNRDAVSAAYARTLSLCIAAYYDARP